jgi:hypothetical protein
MKAEQVPQDDSSTYDGHKKLVYAVDKDGHYKDVKSSGWDVESFATQMAVDDLAQQASDALRDAKAGKVSPLAYHMLKLRFDMTSLAQASGFFQWQIRRHLRPEIFNSLSARKLKIYCDIFDMSAEQLKSL